MHPSSPTVDYRTEPAQYRHWSFTVEGAIARMQLNIAEDGGIRPGYKLKLNSYDLGVDIELHDALNRIRFEHPQVRTVIVTRDRKSTRLNSSHQIISYAVFCLKKKTQNTSN